MTDIVERLEFPEVVSSDSSGKVLVGREMGLIADVQVELVAEIGYASLNISTLFELKSGDVVSLVQSVTDPVLLRLNGKPVARGELVAVNDNFGVKITEIL